MIAILELKLKLKFNNYSILCVCVLGGGGGVLQHLLANMTALVDLMLLVTLLSLLWCLCWEYVSTTCFGWCEATFVVCLGMLQGVATIPKKAAQFLLYITVTVTLAMAAPNYWVSRMHDMEGSRGHATTCMLVSN